MLDQNSRVVDSSGQSLIAFPVDDTDKVDFSKEGEPLIIPRQTVSEFEPTTQVGLGLNLPSDSPVITKAFDPGDATTYNKSTSITVYGASGDSHLATIYYVKTANATAASPLNKWQTHVYIDDQPVESQLIHAANQSGDRYFINKYGEVKSSAELAQLQATSPNPNEYMVVAGTKYKKYSYDNLATPTQSEAASVNFGVAPGTAFADGLNLTNNSNGVDFSAAGMTREALSNLFTLKVDGSAAISIGLEHLAGSTEAMSGTEIAFELTNAINDRFGDSKNFDFTAAASQPLKITRVNAAGAETTVELNMATLLNTYNDNATKITAAEPLTYAINQALLATTGAANDFSDLEVSYDAASQGFRFKQTGNSTDSLYLSSGAAGAARNDVFGVTEQTTSSKGTLLEASDNDESDTILAGVVPNGEPIVAANNQRYGMTVNYINGEFVLASGMTGDASSLELVGATELAQQLLGIPAEGQIVAAETSQISNVPVVRGQAGEPAVLVGKPMNIDPKTAFSVTPTNQNLSVVVDGISRQISIPAGQYSIGNFTAEIEQQINLLADITGRSVSGVNVEFDEASGGLVITGATATDKSFVQIAGHADWGLDGLEAAFGKSSTYIKLEADSDGTSEYYVTQDPEGNWVETQSAVGYTETDVPYWTPIFLDKGELTFDASGTLISPVGGSALASADITGGDIDLSYKGTTQFGSPFAINSRTQNGAPEGDLVDINVSNDGLVLASYSNGTQLSLGKIALANFTTPEGLRQIGDTNYTATSASGDALMAEAGSAGYGGVRSGAVEGSNVDLTSELIALISAQRNFQANAKAIETNSSLTQTIINIRG
jgi:flagellar hook-basal body protein